VVKSAHPLRADLVRRLLVTDRSKSAFGQEAIMAGKMTRGEVQDLVAKFAIENPKYREALIQNPKSVIEKQLNTSLGKVNLKAVVDTADTAYVVVPYAAKQGELSDADLEKVAGGKQDVTANCNIEGSTTRATGGNTVMSVSFG
jgi:hypothetical protein